MKTMICSLLARILFDQPDFDFLEYSGLDFDAGGNSYVEELRDGAFSTVFIRT
jgi:hypothetical protein